MDFFFVKFPAAFGILSMWVLVAFGNSFVTAPAALEKKFIRNYKLLNISGIQKYKEVNTIGSA